MLKRQDCLDSANFIAGSRVSDPFGAEGVDNKLALKASYFNLHELNLGIPINQNT